MILGLGGFTIAEQNPVLSGPHGGSFVAAWEQPTEDQPFEVRPFHSYLTESFYHVVLQNSIPAQIRQLIIWIRDGPHGGSFVAFWAQPTEDQPFELRHFRSYLTQCIYQSDLESQLPTKPST